MMNNIQHRRHVCEGDILPEGQSKRLAFGFARPLPAVISVAGAETLTLISRQLVLATRCTHLCALHEK